MTTQILIANAIALDEEGWALIAPFGEHPKTRQVKQNGRTVTQHFIQILDAASADALLSRENSLFGRIKRAIVGIPVYAGHPDLAEHAPDTIANQAAKTQIGVIDRVRKSAKGIEAHFVLSPEGAQAVERRGAKFPSALWMVQPCGRRGDAILARPFKLLSVGLTPHPNISGVDSLANARGPEIAETPEAPMKLITGWLLAQGVALANAESPTEPQLVEALQQLLTSKTTEAAHLALENSSLKAGRAAAVIDLAIQKGKLTVADRAARIAALENSNQFEQDAKSLLESAAQVIRLPSDAQAGKVLANDLPGGDIRKAHLIAIENHMEETGETDFLRAHQSVLAKNPALKEALNTQPEA